MIDPILTFEHASPDTLVALRGFGFEKLEMLLLKSIEDYRIASNNTFEYEHNIMFDRMDLSSVLWPEVPRGFAYILFDAFKQPLSEGSIKRKASVDSVDSRLKRMETKLDDMLKVSSSIAHNRHHNMIDRKTSDRRCAFVSR